MRQGRKLCGELLLNQWTDESKKKVYQWEAMVQKWLNDNLPDYASDFDSESLLFSLETAGMNAGIVIEHLESRMSILRDILRDIRR